MPRNIKPVGPVSSVADRITGAITAILTITFFSISANTHDAQVQMWGLVSGMLYFMTTLALVFEHADGQ
ncbi:MAG: hypothetical protein JSS83_29060 [Cyanobacteria bacterium SZAS LIN-3]|nr:hypothetical protein [Cyanobacteria bacterium SZAS LIN-3]MBS2009780.1 hypothetical protein [Cyanobacteria bacterium SZAS TMP-1]